MVIACDIAAAFTLYLVTVEVTYSTWLQLRTGQTHRQTDRQDTDRQKTDTQTDRQTQQTQANHITQDT